MSAVLKPTMTVSEFMMAKAEARGPRQPTPSELRLAAAQAIAVERMVGFEFTRLVESEQVEVWRCKKPGTGIYLFDIASTSRGISVMGDIDGLQFKRNTDDGIKFLAGDDVAYYIHSKLEAHCKATELDADGFLRFVYREVAWKARHLIDASPTFRRDLPEEGPVDAAMTVVDNDDLDFGSAVERRSFVDALAALTEFDARRGGSELADFECSALDILNAARSVSTGYLADANKFIAGHIGEWFDVSDGVGTISRIDENLLVSLCMVNAAAREIMVIKEYERIARADSVAPIEEWERLLVAEGHELGGGDVIAMYDVPETPQEGFAAGWKRRAELNAISPVASVGPRTATEAEAIAMTASVVASLADRPRG